MRLLHSIPLSNNSFTFFLPKGMWGNIMIEFIGTTNAGQTGNRANLGSLKFNWNGEDIMNIDVEILNLLNNVYGGVAEATFALAGLNRCIAIIPSGLWYDPSNVFDVDDNDQVSIECNFTAFATQCSVAGGSVNIYSKPKLGFMEYLHKIYRRQVIATGAQTITDTYPVSNISQVYLKDPATANVTDIEIQKNNETVVSGKTAALQAYADNIHKLETTNTTIALEMGESKDPRENLGKQIIYKYVFSGAGTLDQYFSALQYTRDKSIVSRTKAQNKIKANINARI